MEQNTRLVHCLIGAAAAACLPPAAAAQCASDTGSGYTVVPLTGLENATVLGGALNDAGQVAGSLLPGPGDPATIFLWDAGNVTTKQFPGSVATVAGLSEGGLVVGSVRPTTSSDTDIFVWDTTSGQVQIVPTAFEPSPADINDAKRIVGGDQDGTFGFALDAVTGQLDVIAFGEVPAVGVGTLGTAAINAAGVAVGAEVVFDQQQGFFVELPYRWTEAGGIEQLAVVPGGFGGRATSVASNGDIAGYVLDVFFTRSSALWTGDGTVLQNLGSPPNFFVSDALGVNVHGQVIVVAPNDLFGFTRGYLWESGVWTDLSCFAPPGLFVNRPLDLNDPGEILVQLTDSIGLTILDTVILRPDRPFVGSLEVARAGTPPNPAAFLPGVTTGPVVGATWDPVVDHTTFLPGATLDLVGVTLSPANLPLPPFGTLLCDVLTFAPYTFTATPGTPFVIPIPNVGALVGATLCSQAASTDGATTLLTNALDLTLGTF